VESGIKHPKPKLHRNQWNYVLLYNETDQIPYSGADAGAGSDYPISCSVKGPAKRFSNINF
jgi:hypothetical protein